MKGPHQSNYPMAVEDMAGLADELSEERIQYTVERWDAAERPFVIYASSDLSMAQAVFALWKVRRPYGRYLLRQNVEVLERWPPELDEWLNAAP
jgi:hypothetical protein